MPGRLYSRAKLVDAKGAPLKASAFPANQNLIFHYPFAATPCFLLNLGKPAASPVQLKTADDAAYEWKGGVGAARSVVAYSAICAHRLSYPTRDISFISFRAEKSARNRFANVIHCCSEHSQYDPAEGARVLAGPAPQPLASDPAGMGSRQGRDPRRRHAWRRDVRRVLRQVRLQAGARARRRARTAVAGTCVVQELDNYCRQQVTVLAWLHANEPFPPIERALKAPNGLLAAGGDLSLERLLEAYRHGIFPWYSGGADPVVVARSAHGALPRGAQGLALAREKRAQRLRGAHRHRFHRVIDGCADRPQGTWIGGEMIDAYQRCTARATRTRSRPGWMASWSAASTASRSGACSSASRCSRARPTPRRSRWCTSRGSSGAGVPADRLPDAHAAPRLARRARDPAAHLSARIDGVGKLRRVSRNWRRDTT